MLFRRSGAGFDRAELHVLGSVASRLRLAVAARERSAGVERLARSAHWLASRLGLPSLLAEAVDLLPELVAAESSAVVTVVDGSVHLEARYGRPDLTRATLVTPRRVAAWRGSVGRLR